jgi:hypothetical protein
MNSAPTLVVDEKRLTPIELSSTQSEQLPITQAPEIGPGAWKVIIYLLVGSVVFLASLAVYVFSGLYRFQNCL